MNFRMLRRDDHVDFRALMRRMLTQYVTSQAMVTYQCDQGQYNFFLFQLHGIWDQTSTLHQRLSRASFLAAVLPESDGYTLGIGLVPYTREDLSFLGALH